MGIYNKIRGGVNSNHRSGRMDYPYAGDGSPAYSGKDFANEVSSAPKAGKSSAPSAAPSSQRYNVKDGGGDYLRVTPTGGDYNDVSRYGSTGDLKYSTKGARFGHDAKTGMASWGGGKDHGGMGGKGQLSIADGPYND